MRSQVEPKGNASDCLLPVEELEFGELGIIWEIAKEKLIFGDLNETQQM